ncbi:hypothetical protein BMT54_01200 [Pasteurellaceae bacterium 15-036681]|nr:hypothetical protein BMT54_01200 [Pasteurellaceae bacterium 15-036681]
MNSLKQKEWFTASEIAGIADLPTQPTNVTRRATKNNWIKRQVEGKKGVAFEYHYSSLPESVQQALGFSIVRPTTPPLDTIARIEDESVGLDTRKHTNNTPPLDGDTFVVSKARLQTAIATLEEILVITRKTMKPDAKAQMVLMIYELLSEESANDSKIVEMIRLVA